MRLIVEKLDRSAKSDRLTCVREDGSKVVLGLPRQGILPHELLHFIVESSLPFVHGFMAQVAAGADAEYVMAIVHGSDQAKVDLEAAQVEAVVEALQTQLWAGAFDLEQFNEGIRTACASRLKDAPDLRAFDVREILFKSAYELNAAWQQVAPYQTMTLRFPTKSSNRSLEPTSLGKPRSAAQLR